jgi:hypothetical protein
LVPLVYEGVEVAEAVFKVDRQALYQRLAKEGRWDEARDYRDSVIREARRAAGLNLDDATALAWAEMYRCFPPLRPEAHTAPAESSTSIGEQASSSKEDSQPAPAGKPKSPLKNAKRQEFLKKAGPRTVCGMEVPFMWGEIPASAPFEKEVEWVYQNRVLVIDERGGGKVVFRLDRATTPAPSNGALGMLEYSATNLKGFMDLVAKAKFNAVEEEDTEFVKREKKSIAEISRILDMMESAA